MNTQKVSSIICIFILTMFLSTYIHADEKFNYISDIVDLEKTSAIPDKGAPSKKPQKQKISPKVISTPPKKNSIFKFYVDKNNKKINKYLKSLKNIKSIDYKNKYLYILKENLFSEIDIVTRKKIALNNDDSYFYIRDQKIYTNKKTLNIPTEKPNSKQLFIIQFFGPLLAKWKIQFHQYGEIQFISPIPKNAYLVWAKPNAIRKILEVPEIREKLQWIEPYTKQYRIDNVLSNIPNTPIVIDLQLLNHKNIKETLDKIKSEKVRTVIPPRAIGNYYNYRIEAPISIIKKILEYPDVIYISPYYPKSLGDERQSQIIRNNMVESGTTDPCSPISTACESDTSLTTGYLNWVNDQFSENDFQTFSVHIVDSGIDRGSLTTIHPDFLDGNTLVSRLIYAEKITGITSSITDADRADSYGHGTIVASVLAGFNNTMTDADGYHYGLGVAPDARIVSTTRFTCCYDSADADTIADELEDTAPDLVMLYANAYNQSARISSNSWSGDISAGATYSSTSAILDNIVRDALPSSPENQQMTLVFLAGNSGYEDNGTPTLFSDDSYPVSTLWHDGSTAKNVIVVGAGENTSTNPSGCPAGVEGIDISNTWANNALDTAYFSSRGPTVTGRFKPDLIAPGTRIHGAVPVQVPAAPANNTTATNYPNPAKLYCPDTDSIWENTDGFFPLGQNNYHRRLGTSFATPAVAGALVLLKQTFINRKTASANLYANTTTDVAANSPSPSPALNKAWLLNTTTYMTRSGAEIANPVDPIAPGTDTLPSNVQGMGLLNIGRALDSTPRLFRDQLALNIFSSNAQSFSYDGEIPDPTQDFRITLAWTDAVSLMSGALVNDLNLEVIHTNNNSGTVTNTTYLGNNFTLGTSTACPTMCVVDSTNNVESIWISASDIPDTGINTFTISINATTIMGDGVPGVEGVPDDPITAIIDESLLDQDFALVVYNANLNLVNTGLTTLGGKAVNEGSTTIFSENDLAISNSGVENNNIVFSLVSIPTNGILRLRTSTPPETDVFTTLGSAGDSFNLEDIIDGDLSYIHDGLETTTDNFMFSVTDGYGATSGMTETFSISVIPQNDPPEITSPTSVTAIENISFSFINGDLISIIDNDAAVGNMNLSLAVSNGVLTLPGDADGNLADSTASLTGSLSAINNALMNLNYQGVLNFNGMDTLTISIDDNGNTGEGPDGSDNTSVTINVSTVNAPPSAVDDVINTFEDIMFTSVVDLDANDTDSDGDSLTVNAGTFPTTQGGELILAADGSYTYLSASNFNGVDSIDYTVTDGVLTDTGTLTINVAQENDPPSATNDAINAIEDITFTSVVDLDANDTDIDGDSLTVVAGTFATTQGGELVLATDGSYTYLSASNFNGVDSVDYTVTDGALNDTGTLTITVGPDDDAPIVTNETTCVLPASSVDINLTGIDSIDSETVNIVAVDLIGSHPTKPGTITTSSLPTASPSMVTYTPHPSAESDPLLSAAFQDTFMFSVNEVGHVDTAVTGTVTVNVTRGCRQPVDITLVLDTSGSMRQVVPGGTQTKMELLRNSVQMFSDVWLANTIAPNLVGTDRVGLTYFHSTAQQYQTSLEAITAANVLSNLNEDICDPDAVMLCQRTGSGATAMGAGLQEAYSLLTGGAATNSLNTNKFIILFTDGMQNRNPMVNDQIGTTPIEISDVSGRSPADTSATYTPAALQADFKDSNNITIHSIGLGTPGTGTFYDTLQEISNSSDTSTAGTLQITNDATGQLPDIWLNVLVDSLSGSTLEMVGHDEGLFTKKNMRKGKKHSYHLNKTARTATFVLYWQGEQRKDALQFALRHKKSGVLIPAGTLGQKTIKKDFYTIKHLEFPLKLPDGTIIKADSEWEMFINGRLTVDSVDYQTWSMVDDNGVNYRFDIPSRAFSLGEKININAAITNKQGKNIIKKIISADVTVLSPRQGIGTFTSVNKLGRKSNNASITRTLAVPISQPQFDPDSFRNDADKKLFLLLQKPELRKQLVPVKTILPLETTLDNNAKSSFSSTTVPGIYTLRINVMGLAEDGSTIQRTRRFSTVVRMKNISPSKSKIVVKREEIKKGNLQITLTPIDKYGNYLGPGRADTIQLTSTGIEKTGSLVDNLDGSYTQNFVSKSFFGIPVKIKVLGTEFVVDTGIDPRVYWLIVFILLLLVFYGLYRLFKK